MKCPHCGGEVPISTPFSLWLRALPEPHTSRRFDNQNLDYIWHCYRDHWLITLEEKRYGGQCTDAQDDTHGIVAQMLTTASGTRVRTMRGVRSKAYRGHYVVRFEKTTPDDSTWITVNGVFVTKADLLLLLLTGQLPDGEEEHV
ncbi:MAG: hypothetical protein V2A73_16660 [Pseudomonadota bacterium]